MLKRFYLIVVFLMPAFGVAAQDTARLDALTDALQLHEIFAVMQQEGLNYGRDLDRELLNNAGGEKWQQAVDEIYQSERIWQTFLPRFAAELDGADLEAMLAFFENERGHRIISLELSARRALLDEDLEQESREAYHAMLGEGHPRLAMLEDFIEANDLVEYNVMGAMNASYAFYNGMIDGQAFDFELTEDEILRDVWSQEAEIRLDTQEWLYGYLMRAYAPLSDDDLQAYIDFSATKAGRVLNAALFAGFDEVFTNVSKALGLSAAGFMQGEDL
ncbi:MAG: hypothetical protein COB39_00925 [Marinosulfonomonas sp.]|nr:MAG: hypothetical protein COB39_00925 [Marinosulfonomonas sp.]